jgi:hypothetical protein
MALLRLFSTPLQPNRLTLLSHFTVAVAVVMVSSSAVQDTGVRDMSLDDSLLGVQEVDIVPRAGHHRRLSTTDFLLLVGCHTWGRLPTFSGPDALALSDYGCWCGASTMLIDGPCNGGRVVDATDQCCMTHDADRGVNAPLDCNCGTQDYDWDCDILNFEATCDQTQGACATYCCESDLKFANCVNAAAATQNNARKRHCWISERICGSFLRRYGCSYYSS